MNFKKGGFSHPDCIHDVANREEKRWNIMLMMYFVMAATTAVLLVFYAGTEYGKRHSVREYKIADFVPDPEVKLIRHLRIIEANGESLLCGEVRIEDGKRVVYNSERDRLGIAY